MKALLRLTYLGILYGVLTWLAPAAEEKSSAPHFQIIGTRDDSVNEQLPLKSADAKGETDGTVAHIVQTQKYANTEMYPIKAISVFPASTRAGVHVMTLKTGERVIVACVKQSANAKAANLLPGDEIAVESEWTEKRDTVREIILWGLGSSLLTPYTSYSAVDETPKAFDGVAQSALQSVSLPTGVSESEIGKTTNAPVIVKNGSIPEPTSIGLVSFLVVLLALQRRR